MCCKQQSLHKSYSMKKTYLLGQGGALQLNLFIGLPVHSPTQSR